GGSTIWNVMLRYSLGSTDAGIVVTLNVPLTPPTFKVTDVVVSFELEDVNLTRTVLPLTTVPLADVQAPPLIEYSPPATVIGAGILMPSIVITLDSTTLLSCWFVLGENEK